MSMAEPHWSPHEHPHPECDAKPGTLMFVGGGKTLKCKNCEEEFEAAPYIAAHPG